MKMNRVNELKASMNSFGKDAYYKSELLNEMFNLQSEIVALTFNDEHAATANLKIWDVERHLEQLNKDCGNVAEDELKRFKDGSWKLSNLIKAEISGNRGEYKAFSKLDYLRTDHIILKNVELKDEDQRTELDAIVITPYGITIVEVKNTSRNIFIDEEGNYYRTGEFLRWDCQIAQKMAVKEALLRKTLLKADIENLRINKIVVFTDNRIQVQNKYSGIITCFASQLAYIIDGFKSAEQISRGDMENMEFLIREAECKEAYPVGFDVEQYKADFATLMVILEEASAKAEDSVIEEVIEEEKEHVGIVKALKNILKSKYFGYLGGAAAGVAVSLVSTIVAGSLRK